MSVRVDDTARRRRYDRSNLVSHLGDESRQVPHARDGPARGKAKPTNQMPTPPPEAIGWTRQVIGEPKHRSIGSREFSGTEMISVAENTYRLKEAEPVLSVGFPTVYKEANKQRHLVCNLTPIRENDLICIGNAQPRPNGHVGQAIVIAVTCCRAARGPQRRSRTRVGCACGMFAHPPHALGIANPFMRDEECRGLTKVCGSMCGSPPQKWHFSGVQSGVGS